MRLLGRILLAIPTVAFGCLAFIYLTLPDVRPLRELNPTSTAFMELRAREAARRGDSFEPRQRWVGYNRISLNLKRAVLVAEDSAFWEHEGIDFEQIQKSMEINLARREMARGASTITQQLAKNLYLSPSKDPFRKLREFFIARRLEAELSKRRILELYLNVIEWGGGVYGAEAASRAYFRRPAGDLAAEQAALLAAAIINPHVLSVARPSARLRQRQRLIMRRMGAVTPPPPAPEVPQPEPLPAKSLPVIISEPPPERPLPATPLPTSPTLPPVKPPE